jgi:hypothetical protein
MFHKMSLVKRLLCATTLLFTILAIHPVAAVSAVSGDGPTFTPKQQRQADRLSAQYEKLRSDMYGLQDLYATAGSYRQMYVNFLNSEQSNKHDTTMLESNLKLFDSYITQGWNAQKKGMVDLGYPNGLDASGKNVVNIYTVSNEIQPALSDYLTSRNYAASAIYVLHSALNLYHQRTGLGVPDIPKYRLPAYCLACTTSQ